LDVLISALISILFLIDVDFHTTIIYISFFITDQDLAKIRSFMIFSSKFVQQIQDIMERKPFCQKGHILSLEHSMAKLNQIQYSLISVLVGRDCS
jgi:nucleoid-associated protein YejK